MTGLLFILMCFMTSHVSSEYPGEIPGPKRKNDSICIVGGNMAGIHMAVLLKEAGFTNIEVIEKEPVLGGSQTFMTTYRGTDHELGTGGLFNYHDIETINSLVNRYQFTVTNEIPEPNVWVNETTSFTFDDYILEKARHYFSGSRFNVVNQLVAQMQKYIQLHRQHLGTYSGMYFTEPTWPVKMEIFGTFDEFINKNNLKALNPIFEYFLTSMGYGKLSNIAATYGLMICTPRVVLTMMGRLQGNVGIRGYKYDRSGLRRLLDNMVSRENLKVTRDAFVYRVTREHDTVRLRIRHNGGTDEEKRCNFMIWAADLRSSLKYFQNPTKEEYQNFLRLKPRYAVVTLVDTFNQRRTNSPFNIRADADEKDVHSDVNTFAFFQGYSGVAYKMNIYPNGDDNVKTTTAVYRQYTDSEPSLNEMNNILRKQLIELGATSITIRETKIWRFFPNFYHRDLTNGMLYTILKMQGKNKMWYIGSSVSFDSIIGVIDYNRLLVPQTSTAD